jgi:hypothetical protein
VAGKIATELANFGSSAQGLTTGGYYLGQQEGDGYTGDTQNFKVDTVDAIEGLQAMADGAASAVGEDSNADADAAEELYNSKIAGDLDKLANNASDTKAVSDLVTLLGLSKDTKTDFKSASDALYQLRLQSLAALGTLNLLKGNRDKAKFQLGIISGKDFVEFKGAVTSQEINNVLARQYDGLRIRYERALDRAKKAAYLARLSIEQRLGLRFASLNEPVGPQRQAPSVWVDDICSLQGINYTALKTDFGTATADGAQPAAEDDITTQFADAFVGDYVNKLKDLVEFYNIDHPFRESSDTTVLSLKDDLLHGITACSRDSQNELFHSDALYLGGSVDADLSSRQGWRRNPCDGTDCVDVGTGEALNAAVGNGVTGTPEKPQPNKLLPPGGMGGISWLRPYTAPSAPPVPAGEVAPTKSVYQSVDLVAGQEYSISWWEMARKVDGSAPGDSDLAQFSLSIYDSSWRIIGGDERTVSAPVPGQAWSDRQIVRFFTNAEGTYHVAFRLVSRNGSVAIANVQLEKSATPEAAPSFYDSVRDRRLEHNPDCDSVEDLSRFFHYSCQGGGTAKACYWELNQLIALDTEALNRGVGPLVGKIGSGNYNYRLVNTAVNVVGTGVLDCSKDPRSSCYASSFLEYDMDHAAFRAPIDDYNGDVRCFDFGNGTIRGAKALATERYLTNPLSSEDAGLLAQAPFTKQEFFGRPLSGQYRFRIKDTPALQWSNVEDIQIVLGYRYWARVGKSDK